MSPVRDSETKTLPRCNKAWSTTGGSSGAVPDDILLRAARRLGPVGLVYAFCFLSFYLAYAVVSGRPVAAADLPGAITLAALLLGLTMYSVSRWAHWPPCRILSAGLVFQVLASFLIAFIETYWPYAPDDLIHGHSAVAIWIVYFALLIPVSWRQTIVASLFSALTLPAAMALHILLGHVPSPTLGQWILINLAPMLMVAATAPLSRYLFSLGAQVNKAREAGSYEFIERLGLGGMGEVWRARHRMLAREAAVKLIRPRTVGLHESDAIEAARRRFEREAKATAALQSPHTVTLYDYGVTDEGALYYAMELVKGMDLEDLVRKYGPQPPERVVRILTQVCDSLAEAHAHGLTHRDIKPRNILIGRLGLEFDFVKVVDFGLVKALRDSDQTQLTQDGTTTGTPAYMAPEVAMGTADVDERADLYAVGCVGYWLLTGHNVFEGKTAMAVALDHVQTKPIPPSERVETPIPRRLEAAILDCLAKKPEDRPQSALELKALLAGALDGDDWNGHSAESWWRVHAPDVAAQTHAPATLV